MVRRETVNKLLSYLLGSKRFLESSNAYPADYTWALSGYELWVQRDINGIPVFNDETNQINPSAVIGFAFATIQSGDYTVEKILNIQKVLYHNLDDNYGVYTTQSLTSHSGQWYSILYQGLFISFLGWLLGVQEQNNSNPLRMTLSNCIDFVIEQGETHNICTLKHGLLQMNEFPNDDFSEVLNGALVYAVALESVSTLLSNSQRAHLELVRKSIAALIIRCDRGYWSLYQPGTENFSTPDYHNLHTSLLGYLIAIDCHHYNNLESIHKNWSIGSTKIDIRIRALLKKIRWKWKKS